MCAVSTGRHCALPTAGHCVKYALLGVILECVMYEFDIYIYISLSIAVYLINDFYIICVTGDVLL